MSRFSDGDQLNAPDREGSEAQQERRWYYTQFRQAAGAGGSAYGVGRLDSDRWAVDCILPNGTQRRVGAFETWEDALRVQDYCVRRDVATKLSLIELYERGNFEPMKKFLGEALAFGQLPRRRMKVTLEIEIEMSGSDDEISNYLLMHTRSGSSVKGARVLKIDGPRISKPTQST